MASDSQDTALDYDGIVERYASFRRVSLNLNKRLVRLLTRDELLSGARTLGLLGRRNTVVFRAEHDSDVLMDYCLYSVLTDGRSLIDRLAQQPPADCTTEEKELLQRKARSRYRIFLVERAVLDVGIHVQDMLWSNARYFIADFQFSQSARPGIVLAARLIPLDDFWATTGTALPIAAGRSLKGLERICADFVRRFPCDESGPTRQQEADLSGRIIRHLIQSGASERVSYH